MPAIIDTDSGQVFFTCDNCGIEEVAPISLANEMDWRLKDGTKCFCSLACEMSVEAKEVAV